MNHCQVCGKENLKSMYRCQSCDQWVGRNCWDASKKLCAPCADPYAEELADFEADLMADLL